MLLDTMGDPLERRQVVVVLTDGISNVGEDPMAIAESIRGEGRDMFTVSMGCAVDNESLLQLSDLDASCMYELENFDSFASTLIDTLSSSVTDGLAMATNSTCDTTTNAALNFTLGSYDAVNIQVSGAHPTAVIAGSNSISWILGSLTNGAETKMEYDLRPPCTCGGGDVATGLATINLLSAVTYEDDHGHHVDTSGFGGQQAMVHLRDDTGTCEPAAFTLLSYTARSIPALDTTPAGSGRTPTRRLRVLQTEDPETRVCTSYDAKLACNKAWGVSGSEQCRCTWSSNDSCDERSAAPISVPPRSENLFTFLEMTFGTQPGFTGASQAAAAVDFFACEDNFLKLLGDGCFLNVGVARANFTQLPSARVVNQDASEATLDLAVGGQAFPVPVVELGASKNARYQAWIKLFVASVAAALCCCYCAAFKARASMVPAPKDDGYASEKGDTCYPGVEFPNSPCNGKGERVNFHMESDARESPRRTSGNHSTPARAKQVDGLGLVAHYGTESSEDDACDQDPKSQSSPRGHRARLSMLDYEMENPLAPSNPLCHGIHILDINACLPLNSRTFAKRRPRPSQQTQHF
ncbi:unnamed protein product [Chrysoparadoxa australica]